MQEFSSKLDCFALLLPVVVPVNVVRFFRLKQTKSGQV